MDQSENQNKQLLKKQISQLRSGNKQVVLDTLGDIRKTGKSELIPEIIDLYSTMVDAELNIAIKSLLNDLKSEDSRSYIVDALSNPELTHIHRDLVSSCWESGLPYHEYLDTFASLFLEGDLETAIEAFTAIEENCEKAAPDVRNGIINRLQDKKADLDESRKGLAEELIKTLGSYA